MAIESGWAAFCSDKHFVGSGGIFALPHRAWLVTRFLRFTGRIQTNINKHHLIQNMEASPMNRYRATAWLALALAVFAFAGTAAPSFAQIVYNVTNYAEGQNGWSLTGTITASGIGTLTNSSDITAWNITATKDSTSWLFANNAGVSPEVVLFGGNMQATSSELLLDQGAYFRLFSQSNPGPFSFVDWLHGTFGSPRYTAQINESLNILWDTAAFSPVDNGSWVLGTVAVPEPSTSLVLLTLGAGCLLTRLLARLLARLRTSRKA
jgi:hypothetical protein